MPDVKTYWEHEDFGVEYQMGPQKHRLYILDKLAELEVKTLLDLGCGTGPIYGLITSEQYAGRWDNIIRYRGSDYSWRMIETCKKLFPYGDFKVDDARALHEPDDCYDAVLIMHCLDHLDDYASAIKEAVRVSKKYIILCLWNPFVNEGTVLNNKNEYGKQKDAEGNLLPGEEPWEDTHLQYYSKEVLIKEFDKYRLEDVDFNDSEECNDPGRHNIVWILKKP